MRQPLALILLLATTLAAQTPAKHPYTAKDWSAQRSADPVAISPDGQSILYRVTYGATSGPSNHEFWTIHPDGSSAAKLELPTDFTPAGFAPTGTALYGTFRVNDLPQLAVFQLTANHAAPAPTTLVVLPRGVKDIAPSPDGTRFAILADPRLPDPLASTRTIVEPDQTSLYLVNLDGTAGHWACPSLHDITGAGTPALVWSPDSTHLILLSALPKIGHHDVRSFIDICPATSSSTPTRVVDIPNSIASLAYSTPTEIAFISTTNPVLTPDHLYTVPTSGGPFKDRTPDLPTTASALIGDPHGNIFVQINHGVRDEVALWHNATLTPAYNWPDGIVNLPAFSPYTAATSQLVFPIADPTHATNLATLQQSALHRITTEGDAELASVDLGPVRVIHWKSKEGIDLEGIATFPAGYTEGKKYPYLVLPHGGPEANDELALDPFSRAIAGFGYVVVQPQYRGSTGYGDDHLSAIYQHFGDRAYHDVDSATDYAIAQGWADPNHLAIFGWSAGGFMTSWTVTQTSRYKAAIEGAGITDWSPFIFTSDVAQTDYDARWPEENLQAMTQFSAVAFANKVTTPLLILHGEADVRVPTFQGREFYEVLAARGKTVRMVTYPGSPHFPTLWQQRLNVFDEIQAWLTKYNP
jgi:dienelactone hydrolase